MDYIYGPGELLKAAGYENANVYELIKFIDNYRTSMLDVPVAAFGSKLSLSTSPRGGGFIYHKFPTLGLDDEDNNELFFNHEGVPDDRDSWRQKFLCLVRH